MSEEAPPADPAREAVRARVRLRLGEADRLYRQGQPTDAVRLLEPLLSEFDEAELQSGLYAQVCLNLASALAESSRLRPAQALFEAARAIYQQLGDRIRVAEIEFNLGNVAQYANHRQGAHDHYRAALEIARHLGTPAGDMLAGTCMVSLANHLLAMGVVNEARPWLREFEALPASVREQPELRWSYLFQQSKLLRHEGDVDAARAALTQAVLIAQDLGNASYLHETRSALAWLEDAGPGALDTLRAAQAHASEQDGSERLEITFKLARSLAAAGRDDEARQRFDECLEVGALHRSRVDLAQRYHVMEQLVPVVRAYVGWLLQRSEHARAFEVSEHAQGRAMLDLMFRHQTRRQGGRNIRSDGAGRLMLGSPGLAELQPVLASTQAHLLKFFKSGQDALHGWFVGPQGLQVCWDASAALPVLDTLMGALLQLMPTEAASPEASEPGEAADAAHAAEAAAPARGPRPHRVRSPSPPAPDGWAQVQQLLALLAPLLLPPALRRRLARGRGRLVIVAHAELFHLPFAALPLGRTVLAQRWELSVVPSAGCWLQLDPRREAEPECLPSLGPGMGRLPAVVVALNQAQQVAFEFLPGVADSQAVVAFDALEGTVPEARSVLDTLGGVDLTGPLARKPALLMGLRHARVVHLATHGYWHVLGENSFLVLAGEQQPAGSNALFSRDVLEQPMQADLVVLSACQTGLGAPHPDSYIGLAQTFMIAGSRAVLASLWPVGDEVTLGLMRDFYARLSRGASPGSALQAVQRAMRRRPATRSGTCWAAFQFLGWPFEPLGAAERPASEPSAACPGPTLCGGDFLWADGQVGEPLPLAALAPLKLKWNEAVLLRERQLIMMHKG